jgi:sugar phosphate isomerase/epimerase
VVGARDLRWPDLVWSHFSRPRYGQFDERVAAAAAVGIRGLGLYVPDYCRMRDEEGRDPAEVAATLAARGLAVAEIEALRGWWATSGPERDEFAELAAVAFEMADVFAARYLQVIGSYECPFEQAVAGFAALCDRAAEHGLLVGIEWLPFTNIVTADDARRIVEAADRPNGGYCADIWHHARGADDLGMIRSLGAERVFAVQMSDGTRLPSSTADYKTDCMTTRVPPGEGELDCVGFVRTLYEMGVRAPISLEVCSTELWAAPALDAARLAADGMRRVLRAAGLPADRE